MIRSRPLAFAVTLWLAGIPAQAQSNPLGSTLNGLWADPSLPKRVVVFVPTPGAREAELPIGRVVIKPASDTPGRMIVVSVASAMCTYSVNPSNGTQDLGTHDFEVMFRPAVKAGRRMTWRLAAGQSPCPPFAEFVRLDKPQVEAPVLAIEACDRLAADPWDATRPASVAGVESIYSNTGANPLSACQEAAAQLPENGRIIFQLARVLDFAAFQLTPGYSDIPDAEASRLYQRATLMGHAAAMTALGVKMLYWGPLDSRREHADATAAAGLFRKAAEAGHVGGMFQLARLNSKGDGIPQDLPKSIDLFRRAAKGSAQAGGLKLKYIMRALAAAYKSSSELPDIEVVDWFTQAATAKDEDAVSFMVWLHREGRGVPRDAAEAQRWRHTIRPPISAEERARRKAEYDGRCRNKAPRGGDIEWCMFMRGWEN